MTTHLFSFCPGKGRGIPKPPEDMRGCRTVHSWSQTLRIVVPSLIQPFYICRSRARCAKFEIYVVEVKRSQRSCDVMPSVSALVDPAQSA